MWSPRSNGQHIPTQETESQVPAVWLEIAEVKEGWVKQRVATPSRGALLSAPTIGSQAVDIRVLPELQTIFQEKLQHILTITSPFKCLQLMQFLITLCKADEPIYGLWIAIWPPADDLCITKYFLLWSLLPWQPTVMMNIVMIILLFFWVQVTALVL